MGGRRKNSAAYLAGLDGLRAIAVAAVLIYHLFPTIIRGGFIGVDIFFVLSGFLITSLLITEHTKTGRIDLKQFWVRRARRLLPALFATIGVTCSIALFIGGDILVGLGRQVLGAATFSANWVEVASGANYFDASSLHIFTNFWSLAVEEQFYALWPFILVAILSISVVARRYRVGLWLSLVFAGISAGLMFVLFSDESLTRVYYGSDTHAFGLMIGAALAFWGNVRFIKATDRHEAWPSARFKRPRILQTLGWLSLAGILTLVVILPELAAITYQGGLLLASLLTAVVILAAINNKGYLQRLLELRWLRWIGVRSYGIYLWHWPVIVLCYYALPADVRWVTPIVTIVTSVTVATLSYHYLEQPIRNMGIRAFFTQGFSREFGFKRWKLRAHPFATIWLVALIMTTAAIATAPAKTKAQRQVESNTALLARLQKQTPAKATSHRPKKITGSNITVVGDSVSLASAPELQTKFPGIYINAAVSRSMRRGGLETVELLLKREQMRQVLVVALGTNGYYGDGTIDQLLRVVGPDRDVIFVTAHAPVVWVPSNNAAVHDAARRHKNVTIAEWDKIISARPGILGPDDIHPGPTGGKLYADSIAAAIAKFH